MTKELYDVTKTFLKSEASLLNLISDRVTKKTSDNSVTIVCAGHFMLIPDHDKEKLIPGIFDTGNSEAKAAQIATGIFPQYTWHIGCTILEKIKTTGEKGFLSLLINDWQLVPPDPDRQPEKPNRFRESFYKDFTTLPTLYEKTMQQFGLSFPVDMYCIGEREFYLREVALRDRFARKMKNMVTEDAGVIPVGMCSLNLDECGNILMNNEDDAPYKLTVSSKAGCAGGVCQMMVDIGHRLATDHKRINFINLMPNGCTIPVNIASELAINMLSEEVNHLSVTVTNIFFEGYNTITEQDFYIVPGRHVSCYEF